MTLLAVAARYLQQRADQQAIGAAPAAYQLLYDFWAGRSDWQAAAAAQLALARRLAAEAPSADEPTLGLIAVALGEQIGPQLHAERRLDAHQGNYNFGGDGRNQAAAALKLQRAAAGVNNITNVLRC